MKLCLVDFMKIESSFNDGKAWTGIYVVLGYSLMRRQVNLLFYAQP